MSVDYAKERPFFMHSAKELRAAFENGLADMTRLELELLREECRRREHKASVRKLGEEIEAVLVKLRED